MKVVHLQYHSESAGKQALRLHQAFLDNGIESTVLSLYGEQSHENRVSALGRKARIVSTVDSKLQNYLVRKSDKQLGLFSYPILGTDVSAHQYVVEADVIYIHWVLFGFLNISNLRKLAQLNKPIVFFMHDMWTITGGCHYSFDCERYSAGCGFCPLLSSNKKNDMSSALFRKKMKLFAAYSNLFFVTPSKWLYECAKQSLLTKDKPLFLIPNLVDNRIFKSFDSHIAKDLLDLDRNEIVIAFGAVSVGSPYKGWSYLQKALDILRTRAVAEDITVLIFGSGYNKEIADSIPFKTKFMGYMKDDYSMNLIYNAADVFVAPSLAETFGLVVLEALSCGTAVVAFDVGGIPDLIMHKENGYLAKYKDPEDLAEGIEFCIREDIKGRMLPEFEPALTVGKHVELFNHIKLDDNSYAYGDIATAEIS